MRLWSLHPKYLDPKGLVAVWREGLLALKVLRGETIGYKHHPQLDRFRATKDPVETLKCYLWHIYAESQRRGYNFSADKIARPKRFRRVAVADGQLDFELTHLRAKLKTRNRSMYRNLSGVKHPAPHPLFRVVPGAVHVWERGKNEQGNRRPHA